MTNTASKKRGLGRGLSNLLSETAFDMNTLIPSTEKISQLAIEQLQPGKHQPRQTFTDTSLQELADSIRAQGIIQPIIVRKTSASHYEIIAGERRWRAAQLAGLTDIPVIIRDVPDEAAMAMALIENIQRENLNPLEEARALKRLQEEFHLTQLQTAQAIGKSRVSVTHLLRLLDLHPDVQQLIQKEAIDKGHAKALLSLSHADQVKAALLITQKGLSVRETEKLVKYWATPSSAKIKKSADSDISALEKKLSTQLGTSVAIQHHPKGHGKLVIHYHNLDILEGILARFK